MFFFAEFELPPSFNSWLDVIRAIVDAQTEGLSLDEVHKDTWQVFQTVAFSVNPKGKQVSSNESVQILQ